MKARTSVFQRTGIQARVELNQKVVWRVRQELGVASLTESVQPRFQVGVDQQQHFCNTLALAMKQALTRFFRLLHICYTRQVKGSPIPPYLGIIVSVTPISLAPPAGIEPTTY